MNLNLKLYGSFNLSIGSMVLCGYYQLNPHLYRFTPASDAFLALIGH